MSGFVQFMTGGGRYANRVVGRVPVGVFLCLAAMVCPGCNTASQNENPLAALLAPLFPPSPSQVARDAFNVYDADARRTSVTQLSASSFGGEAPYLRMYRLLLDDPDPTVSAACVKAIGMHGGVDDATLIARQMSHESPIVRWEAAKALQRIHNPEVVGGLIEALAGDEDSDVRMAAAYALGQYAQPKVFHALVGALEDRSYGVVGASGASLRTLTGYDFGTDGGLWLIWARKNANQLFEHQEVYVWCPYEQPPGFFDKAKFWKKPEPVTPRLPTGLVLGSE